MGTSPVAHATASVDPIYAATNIDQSVQAVQTREINALNPAVVMFTEFHAGSDYPHPLSSSSCRNSSSHFLNYAVIFLLIHLTIPETHYNITIVR